MFSNHNYGTPPNTCQLPEMPQISGIQPMQRQDSSSVQPNLTELKSEPKDSHELPPPHPTSENNQDGL